MEAAAMGMGGESEDQREMESKLHAMEAELRLQKSAAASAQAQALEASRRADSLQERLEASENAMQKMSAEVDAGRTGGHHSHSITPPPPHSPALYEDSPEVHVHSPVDYGVHTISPSPAADGSSWIERYRKIVN